MGLLYVGDCSFQETENSGGIVCDPWGLDTLTREWEGRKDLLDDFLQDIAPTSVTSRAGSLALSRSRSIADVQLPQMFLTTMSVDVGRAFAKITGTFRGISNGREPLPKIENSCRIQEVTLPYVENGAVTSQSGTFTYNALSTTFTYWTRKEPRKRRYAGQIFGVQGGLNIVARTGVPGQIKFYKGQTLTSNIFNLTSLANQGAPDAYNANVECFQDEFSSSQDGQWWQVVESNSLVLTATDFLQLGWIIQL